MKTETHYGEMTIEEAAMEAAGNWRTFECFVWWRKDDLNHPEDWMIHYTHHRDSGLLDQSNASVIRKRLLPFTEGDDPGVVFESHTHWAVGHIDGFSLRVFRDGEITEAFHIYHGLMEQKDTYPILDETDYSNREYEATIANILDSAWKLKDEFDLPEDWEYQVYDWYSENLYRAIENRDDQGGYPEQEDLKKAFLALKYPLTP